MVSMPGPMDHRSPAVLDVDREQLLCISRLSSMSSHFLQTCLQPLKAEQTKQVQAKCYKNSKGYFQAKKQQQNGFFSSQLISSLFSIFNIVLCWVFFFNMTVFSTAIHPQAQCAMPYGTALQMGFTLVEVLCPYSNLPTLY